MNIDLRNISEDFENTVNEVKLRFEINTNSKAVEYCTVNYLKKLKEIEDLRTQLHTAKNDLRDLKYHVDGFKGHFNALFKKK
nr:hypothetical protein [uncultured Flavobacterium sp.]